MYNYYKNEFRLKTRDAHIPENILKWRHNLELLAQKPNQDKNKIQESINNIDKKWSSLTVFVNDYRDHLNKAVEFQKLFDEVDLWATQKVEHLKQLDVRRETLSINPTIQSLTEIHSIVRQIDDYIEEYNRVNKEKVKYLTELSIQIYGSLFLYKYFFVIKLFDVLSRS